VEKIAIPKEELKKLYQEKKLTTYEIARIFNCSQSTVWKCLHEFGIKPRYPWNAVKLSKKELESLYFKKGLSTWEIEKRMGIPRSTVHRKLIEFGFKLRTRAQSHIIYLRRDFNGSKVDKAYLIGFALGDLRVRKIYPNSETIFVDCGSTKKAQIDLIVRLFKPYGRVWISQSNKKGKRHIQCALNDSFDFLMKKRTLIDRWILKNKNYFAAFLAGLTDAEGSIFISKLNQATYSLGNYNYRLLYQIRNYLIKLGIKCPPIIKSRTHEGYVTKEGYMNKHPYWLLRITRKFYLLKLLDLITPYLKHSDKIKRAKKARENIRTRNKKFRNINMKP
jgi:DNA-binding CsgD family transcriptional regulator